MKCFMNDTFLLYHNNLKGLRTYAKKPKYECITIDNSHNYLNFDLFKEKTNQLPQLGKA